jgi:endoglucanase
MATGLVSVPLRYMHTSSEIISTDDVDATVALLTQFVRSLGPDLDLTP